MNRVFACATALGLVLALEGCGGGASGVATGSPPIASSPTPSPAPSPTPAPSSNTSLLAPLTSETFRNVASVGTISAPKSGAIVSTSASADALTVAYNAGTQAYTVTDSAATRTFGAGSIDSTQSSAALTTYKVVSGGTTDFLSLTTNGTGAGQTKYVSGGFWQRQVDGGSSVDGRYVAFAYGVQTPDGLLPRTGVASFDVKLLGASTFSTIIYGLSGSGVLNADLLTGAIAAIGTYDATDTSTGFGPKGSQWRANALIASSSNAFNGSMTLDNIGTGEVHGSLFGPAAEEVGATFSTNPNSDVAAVGTLYGARGSYALNQSTNLSLPENDTFYRPLARSVKAQLDATGKITSATAAPGIVSVYRKKDGVSTLFYGPDGRITQPLPAGFNTPVTYDILATNMQYLRVAEQIDRRSTLAQFDALVFGQDTAAAAVPRTGTASFAVTMAGGVTAPDAAIQTLGGNGTLNANFATGAISTLGAWAVTANVPATGAGGGATTDSGSWSGTGTLSSAANAFTSSIALTGGNTYNGTAAGQFYGPAAEETGAAFQATAANGSIATGVLYGGRGADTTASQTKLLDLTSTAVLTAQDIQYLYTPALSPAQGTASDYKVEVTYDPAVKSYQIKAIPIDGVGSPRFPVGVNIVAADRDATKSDATFDVYHTATYDARIFKPGADNPKVALSYMSFADIMQSGVSDGRTSQIDYFVMFGGASLSYQMPKTGMASYTGVVYGHGYDGKVNRDAALSGSSKYSVDFATGAANLAMTLDSTDVTNGVARTLGSFLYSIGPCSAGSLGCSGPTFGLTATPGSTYSGNASGRYFGPNAAEVGIVFDLNIERPSGSFESSSTFAGISVGKKD